jgi:hypothetical protein
VQAVHQFSQTLEASHNFQRIAASLVKYVRLSVASRRLLLPETWLSTPGSVRTALTCRLSG